MPKYIPNLNDPIVFGDLRDRETAERKRLGERYRNLKDEISAKRSLTLEEKAELDEIGQKLATDDVVDPLFKAIQRGLTPDVGDHKDGLLPSQQRWDALRTIFSYPAPDIITNSPNWALLVELSGLKQFDADNGNRLVGSLQAFNDFADTAAKRQKVVAYLKGVAEAFNKFVGTMTQEPPPDLNKLAAAIKNVPTDPSLKFGLTLADAVIAGLVSESEALADWVLAIYDSNAPLKIQTLNNFAEMADAERLLAGVFGILAADKEEPPAYHLPVAKPSFDPSEARRRQSFGKALFTAQGEYSTNKGLFLAVLPILVKLGEQGPLDEVRAAEWAQVIRYLLKRGVTESEPQLTRRVGEALDSIQNVGDDLPPSDIGIDLPDLEEETTDFEIVADNIRALQPAYFAAMFEELKVFQVMDKLVELFQNGVLPIGRGEAGNSLFKYWKETSSRVSEDERRSFYARTLGIPGGDDGGLPNREFNDLWMRFISGVSACIRQNTVDELLRARIPGRISQQQVRKAGRDLAANLSLHGYGMAYFMATELQKQIKDVIKLLSDDDIKNAYGARDMWQVIDQVAALELGGPKNSVRYRTMAASGAIIMAWLAKNARKLASTSFGDILNLDEIRNPSPRPSGSKPTTDPTDFDLVNACEQWLAVTGTQEDAVEDYAQPKEAPNMTSKPIQIPNIAREMLESVGVPAMGLGSNGYRR